MNHSPQILVVEDEEITADLITYTLCAYGYQVTVIDDGETAWRTLQGGMKFDAVLLDRGLPRLDGLSLLKRIKSDAALRPIPVVMETGRDDMGSVIEGIDAGAYYYLIKPLYPPLLLSVLKAAIDQRRDFLTMQRPAGEHALVLNYLQSATFCCRTLSEARELANGLSHFCPAPQRAVLGLHELLINAIEHGNLGISYTLRGAVFGF